ncbi:hypothetical protein TrVGV298_002230 [Trichoderma virens]|nr:hypothetical protein TrVGV298_002230 [Trichoderma virens]
MAVSQRDEKEAPTDETVESIETSDTETVTSAQDILPDTVNAKYTEDDYARVLKKIDRLLLPLMWLCNGTQQADKAAISTQVTFGMQSDTKLVGQQFSWLMTAFYLAYLVGEAPGNYLMQRFNVNKTLFISNEVRWLSKEEKHIVATRVANNQTGSDSHQNHAWRWDQVQDAIEDPQTYFFFFTVISVAIPVGGTVTFGNLIYGSFGFTNLEAIVKGTIPFDLLTVSWYLFVGVSTLKKPQSRFFFMIASTIPPFAGMLALALLPKEGMLWTRWGLYLMTATGRLPGLLIWTLLPSNIAGRTKKSVTSAVIFIAYCTGNAIGAQVFRAEWAPRYIPAIIICGVIVITVHGIRDDYKTAWTREDEVSWIEDTLFKDNSIRQVDYAYDIDENATIYKLDGIKLHAEALIQAYAQNRSHLKKTDKDRPITWICHDLGGTIVKEALRLALSDRRKYGEIALLTRAIIFLGTPHWFQSIQDAEDQLLNLVQLPGPTIRPGILNKVQNLAKDVEKVHEKFLETKLLDYTIIANIYVQNWSQSMSQRRLGGDKTTPEGRDEDELPDPITPFSQHCHVIGQASDSREIYRLDNTNHADLVHGDDQDTWMKRLSKNLNRFGYCHEIRQFRAKLLSLVPPTVGLDITFDPLQPIPPVIIWIMKQEPYARFEKTGSGLQVLHLFADQGSLVDIKQVSRIFYLQINKNPQIVERSTIYFEFDQWDSRYNSISSMMVYIINIIIHQLGSNDKLLLQVIPILDMHAWALEDVYHLYRMLLWYAAAKVQLIIFLGCFDKCLKDQRQWFLERILEENSYSERDYRLVLSTSTRDGLGVELPGTTEFNMNDCPSTSDLSKSNTEKLISKLEKLFTKRPIYQQFQQQLKTLLRECDATPYLGNIILDWLGSLPWSRTASEIASTIDNLSPVTAENTVSVFISSQGSERRKRAGKIFNWIKHAAEPWTLESLSEAIAVDELQSGEPQLTEINAQGVLTEMQNIFGGIVCIKNCNVKFSHESFYFVPEIGLNGSAEDRASHVHYTIAKVCLDWLQLQSAHKTLDECYPEILDDNKSNSVSDGVVIYRPRVSMAEYAVQFWPYHYKTSGKFRPSHLANNLFANKEAKKRWEGAFRLLSNPFNRLMGSYSSELPLCAMLGLDDLVDENLKVNIGQPSLNKICWSAISEAAREGHSAIVDKLLQQVTVDEEELQNSLLLGAGQGNQGIVKALFNKIPDLKTFAWPKNFFYRAASLGLDDVLTTMLQSGYGINTLSSSHLLTAIDIATARNHISSREILLKSNLNPDLNIQGDYAVSIAVQMGDPQMMAMILDAVAGKIKQPVSGQTLAQMAAYNFNHEVLKLLIETGCELGSKNDDGVDISLRHPLIIAAFRGATKCAQVLLNNGGDAINFGSVKSALYEAVSNGHMEIVRLLLQHDPTQDVNAQYPGKGILLTQAINRQDTGLVSLLIEYGAGIDVLDPNVDDMFMKTPLSLACFKGHLDMVKLLIEKGANINFMTESSHPPLFAALISSTSQVAKYLLQHDVKIHVTGPGWMNVLIAAAGHPQIVQKLLRKRINVDHYSAYGTVLMRAAEKNAPKTIQLLLNHYDGAKSKRPDLEAVFGKGIAASPFVGFTALQIACYCQNPKCVKLLLDAGAEVSFRNMYGDDALDILLQRDQWSKRVKECIQLLLSDSNRIDVLHVNYKKQTRLHFIKKTTRVPVVELLAAAKVPFRWKDRDGYTPLALAIEAGNVGVIQYLIKLGANVNERHPIFGSMLHVAVAKHDMNILKMLVDAGAVCGAVDLASGGSLLSAALDIRYSSSLLRRMVKCLVDEAKAPINQFDGKSSYPLIKTVAMIGSMSSAGDKILKFLVMRNADVNVTDSQGRTALHIACSTPYIDRVKVLIEAGANIDAKDKFGRLPIHFAAAAPSADGFFYLLEQSKDMDIDVADNDGWTPLLWAARSGAAETITRLVDQGADVCVRSHPDYFYNSWSAINLLNLSGNHTGLRHKLMPKKKNTAKYKEWKEIYRNIRPGERKNYF